MTFAPLRFYKGERKISCPKPRKPDQYRDECTGETINDPTPAKRPAAQISKELPDLPDIRTAVREKRGHQNRRPRGDGDRGKAKRRWIFVRFRQFSYFTFGTPRSLQIFRASSSVISLCLGTAERRFCSGLCHHECLPPSGNSSHPGDERCRKSCLRFIRLSAFRESCHPQTPGLLAG